MYAAPVIAGTSVNNGALIFPDKLRRTPLCRRHIPRNGPSLRSGIFLARLAVFIAADVPAFGAAPAWAGVPAGADVRAAQPGCGAASLRAGPLWPGSACGQRCRHLAHAHLALSGWFRSAQTLSLFAPCPSCYPDRPPFCLRALLVLAQGQAGAGVPADLAASAKPWVLRAHPGQARGAPGPVFPVARSGPVECAARARVRLPAPLLCRKGKEVVAKLYSDGCSGRSKHCPWPWL